MNNISNINSSPTTINTSIAIPIDINTHTVSPCYFINFEDKKGDKLSLIPSDMHVKKFLLSPPEVRFPLLRGRLPWTDPAAASEPEQTQSAGKQARWMPPVGPSAWPWTYSP